MNDESMENGNGKTIWHEIESWRFDMKFYFSKNIFKGQRHCMRFISFHFYISANRYDWTGFLLLLFICARCMVYEELYAYKQK